MIDSNNVDVSLLYKCFYSIGRPVVIPVCISKGKSIIRVRINDNDKFFDDIYELSYPPCGKSKLMRASLPGHPMFYGALYSGIPNPNHPYPRIITLYETSELLSAPEFSGCQMVTYSKWTLKKDIYVFALPISNNYMEYTYEAINIQKCWIDIKTNIAPTDAIISNFFGDLIAKDGTNSIYTVTANLINYILNDKKMNYQGVVYPTRPLNGAGLNIAITPQTVDDNCFLESAATNIFVKQNTNAELLRFADATWDSMGHIKWGIIEGRNRILSNFRPNYT